MEEENNDITLNLTLKPDFVPTLYDINKSFNVIKVDHYDGIQGEDKGRMCVFTNFILGRHPILLCGPRASGKTNMMSIITEYSPNIMKVASASEKADIRDSSLNEASHVVIPEINKISRSFVETLKDWGEGVESTYKTLNEWKRPVTLTLDPKPFISSIANENDNVLGEELLSRLTVIHMDASIKQNVNVIEDKLDRAQNPFKKRELTPEYVKNCISYVKGLPNIRNYDFIYLPGKTIMKTIPARFTDARRDVEKYLFNTYGISLFYFYNRIVIQKGKKKAILVAPEDVWYNHRVYGENLIQSALKCGPQEMLIIKILKKNMEDYPSRPSMNIQELYSSILHNGITPTTNTVTKMCENLYKNGIIIKNLENRPTTYQASSFFKEFSANIDWLDVVNECKKSVQTNFPLVADEYIRRFCGEEITVIDPFTGKTLNILSDNEEFDDIQVKKKKDLDVYIDKKEKEPDSLMEITEEIVGSDEILNDKTSILEGSNEDNLDKLRSRCKKFFEEHKGDDGTIDAEAVEEHFSGIDLNNLLKMGELAESQGRYMYLD